MTQLTKKITKKRKIKYNFPFDVELFEKENKNLIRKYLSKSTKKLKVPDFENIDSSWYYSANENLLRGRLKLEDEYTVLQKLEWIKCRDNIIYFIEKYVQIISIDDGVIPFRMYKYQKELVKLFDDFRFVIATQCRQSGKTQTTASYLLHYAIFNTSKNIAILANKGSQAQEILERIQQSYEFLPKFLQGGVRSFNKRSMKLDNLSQIFCAATSSSSIRGKSVAILYIDETAFIQNDIKFFESTYPVISSGKESRVILTSTPNGQKGYFYKTWIESLSKKNNFANMLVTWEMVPGRDKEWFDEQVANTSYEQVMQEHGCQFRGSQNSLLNTDTLGRLIVYPVIEKFDSLKIYENPIKKGDLFDGTESKEDHIYAMCVDTSLGVGKDYSAFIVVDISQKPFKVVATFRDNYISPLRYPYIIHSTGQKYNNAFILVENNMGDVANTLFHQLEYENIFTTRVENRQLILGFGLAGATSQVGIRTTTRTKSLGITNIKALIERNHFTPSDPNLIDEFGTFIPKGNSYEADKDCNDDLVMCSVLFGWLSTQDFFEDLTDIKTRSMVINRWKEELESEFTPFGIIESNEFGSFEPSINNDIIESSSNFIF